MPLEPVASTAVAAPAPETYDQDFAAVCKAVHDDFYDPNFNGLNWPIVQKEYAERLKSVTDDKQFLTLVNDLLSRLHASHTRLYGPDELEYYLLPEVVYGDRRRDDTRSKLSVFQIGALSSADDPAQIAAVLDGSPAAMAGLRAGDMLVSVDGQPYHGLTQFSKAPAQLVYRRAGVDTAIVATPVDATPLTLMMEAVNKSARVISLPDGRRIGYVHLWIMAGPAFQGALEDLVLGKLHDTDGLVLDLRQGYGGNPNGYTAPFFRPDFELSVRGHRDTKWSSGVHEGYSKPVVVLADHGTRSAKEMLTWALQYSKRATIVGQKTAGAVLGLHLFSIGSKFQLELAAVEMKLNGVSLEGRGVTPDIALAGVPSDADYLKKALQMLDKKKPQYSSPPKSTSRSSQAIDMKSPG